MTLSKRSYTLNRDGAEGIFSGCFSHHGTAELGFEGVAPMEMRLEQQVGAIVEDLNSVYIAFTLSPVVDYSLLKGKKRHSHICILEISFSSVVDDWTESCLNYRGA